MKTALLLLAALLTVACAWADMPGVTYEQLTEGDGSTPTWSPDGAKVAFIRFDGTSQNLWAMDISSRNETQITHSDQAPASPAWSPDGKWIAYTDTVDAAQRIILVSPDGAQTRPLDTGEGWPTSPTWDLKEPNKIAFNNIGANGGGIYLLDIETGKVVQVTDSQESEPTLGPNGLLAYVAREQSNANSVWLKDLRTGKSTIVAKGEDTMGQYGGGYSQPAYSPRGTYLAYMLMPLQPTADILVRDLRTDVVMQLTSDGMDNQGPAWSPNGQQIVFSSRRGDGITRLWVAKLQLKYPEPVVAQPPAPPTVPPPPTPTPPPSSG